MPVKSSKRIAQEGYAGTMSAANYQSVEESFRDGTIEAQDTETLGLFLLTLANQPLPNEFVRHRDIIRGFTINHILLQRHIGALDKKNARTTVLVVVLTIASLIGTASQTWYGYKADKKSEAESRSTEAKSQPQQHQSGNQTQVTQPAAQASAIPGVSSTSER